MIKEKIVMKKEKYYLKNNIMVHKLIVKYN